MLTLTIIAEKFLSVLECRKRKTHLLIYRHLLFICMTCRVWHLMLVYEPLGCYRELRFVQSLPNCQRHCPYLPRTASYQLRAVCNRLVHRASPSQTLCSAIIAASPPSSTAAMVAKPPEAETCTVGSCTQARIMAFQQDHTRPHVARVAMDLHRRQNIQVMEWPALSPVPAPIDNVWGEMDRRLRQRRNLPIAHFYLVVFWRAAPS